MITGQGFLQRPGSGVKGARGVRVHLALEAEHGPPTLDEGEKGAVLRGLPSAPPETEGVLYRCLEVLSGACLKFFAAGVLRKDDSRSVNGINFDSGQRLIHAIERKDRHLGLDPDLARNAQEVARVGTGHVGNTADLPLAP
jgi:hypothetical protein